MDNKKVLSLYNNSNILIVRFLATDADQQHYVLRRSWSRLTNHLFCHGSKVRGTPVELTPIVVSLHYTDVSRWCHLTLWPAHCFRALISHWPRLLPRHPLTPSMTPPTPVVRSHACWHQWSSLFPLSLIARLWLVDVVDTVFGFFSPALHATTSASHKRDSRKT